MSQKSFLLQVAVKVEMKILILETGAVHFHTCSFMLRYFRMFENFFVDKYKLI